MTSRSLKHLCVFCGSSSGTRPQYAQAARRLGRVFLSEGIGLVYGGASVGVMGQIADTVLAGGGKVIGVIPRGLAHKEVAHAGLTDLRIVDSMHERKALMAELVDGFIALPGGLGTFEEFFEVLTWCQLGIHRKPCALLNTEGYYDKLVGLIDHAIDEGFVRSEHRSMVVVDHDPQTLIEKMRSAELPHVRTWITRQQT